MSNLIPAEKDKIILEKLGYPPAVQRMKQLQPSQNLEWCIEIIDDLGWFWERIGGSFCIVRHDRERFFSTIGEGAPYRGEVRSGRPLAEELAATLYAALTQERSPE